MIAFRHSITPPRISVHTFFTTPMPILFALICCSFSSIDRAVAESQSAKHQRPSTKPAVTAPAVTMPSAEDDAEDPHDALNLTESGESKEPLSFSQERERIRIYCRTRINDAACLEYKTLTAKQRHQISRSQCAAGDFSDKCIRRKSEQLDAFYKADSVCTGEEKTLREIASCKKKRDTLLRLR